MRLAAFVVFAGCGFSIAAPGVTPIDAPDAPDVPDVLPVTWAVDTLSGKATPQSTTEWGDLIAARGLAVAVPDGLWLMQEPSGPLVDSIGSVSLAPYGAPMYRAPVTGWSRQGVKTLDGSGAGFYDTTASSLPDVGTASIPC